MGRRLVGVFVAALVAIAVAAGPAGAQVELPDPPQIPVIPIPEQVDPVLGLLSPVGNPVCGTLGLGLALSSLLSGSAPLPIDTAELLPYLGPIFLTCGYIPIVEAPNICELDNQVKAAVSAQLPLPLPIPGPIGTALDQINAVILMVEGLTGQDLPVNPVDILAEPLDCTSAATIDDPAAPAPPLDEAPLGDTGEQVLGDTAAAPGEAQTTPATGWNAAAAWFGALALGLAVAGRRVTRRV
jgi:hypothetical protein